MNEEFFEMLDKRVKEKYNIDCAVIATGGRKVLYFNLENGLPIVEFEIVSMVHTISGPRFEISEFDFAHKLIG
jgi:hypothetical protein